jgi:hypothetical protein
MSEGSSQDSGFKVVDRRPFSEDGTRRPDAEKEIEKPEVRHVPPAPSSPVDDRERGEDFDLEGSGFETLVSSLSTTAMFQLGALPGPAGEYIPPDMPNARRTIDLLAMLKEKTRGNLTPAESRLLESVLYELRLSYVEVGKRGARKHK